MLNISGQKLVKFLYQNQQSKHFDIVQHKIKNHKKYKTFSIDDIYIFLLLYAPNFIAKNRYNEKIESEQYLSVIFIDILKKAPKLTTKNFAIPSHIPFLFIKKKYFKKQKKPSFLINLDGLSYYLPKISNFSKKINTKNNYYTYNENNIRDKPHSLLSGIKKIVSNNKNYDLNYAENILHNVVPYSSILLRAHNNYYYFKNNHSNIQKRFNCLNKHEEINLETILFFSQLTRKNSANQEYVLYQISNRSKGYLNKNILNTLIKNFLQLSKTKIFHNIQEKKFLRFYQAIQKNELTDFENIYAWFPKQTILNHNVSITEHLNSINCIDIFLNANTLTNLQQTIEFTTQLSPIIEQNDLTAFEILENNIISKYFFDNTPLIYEVLSSYRENKIPNLLNNNNIKNAIIDFFKNIDQHLETDKKDFLLSPIFEISIEKNLWTPNTKQLTIIKNFFEIETKKSSLFSNLYCNQNTYSSKIEMINNLLFEHELENLIPNCKLENQRKITKY